MTFDEASARLVAALAGRPSRNLDLPAFAPASVLIAVLRRGENASVLFTRRTESVRTHKGQIAFPGGRATPFESRAAAALREAEEEVGLPPGAVNVIGVLDDYPTVSRFVVAPVVGLVADPPAAFSAQPGEVVEPFEVALARLREPARHLVEWRDESRMPRGVPADVVAALRTHSGEYDPTTGRYGIHAFDHTGEPPFAAHKDGALPSNDLIWGVTGRILASFLHAGFSIKPDQG